MIIGKGMLAQAFNVYKDDEVIIFASGVSDSLEKNEEAFIREIDLIEKTIVVNKDKLFVYFSTCSMYDPLAKKTPYVQHKLKIEKMISLRTDKYLILRISQVLGRSKNTTLINFLFEYIKLKKRFDVWENSNRNLIALADVVQISQKLIQDKVHYNQIFHIANKIYIDVPDLVTMIEKILNKKAKCQFIKKGQKYQTIPSDIESVVQGLDISFDKEYYFRNLLAYYQSYLQ